MSRLRHGISTLRRCLSTISMNGICSMGRCRTSAALNASSVSAASRLPRQKPPPYTIQRGTRPQPANTSWASRSCRLDSGINWSGCSPLAMSPMAIFLRLSRNPKASGTESGTHWRQDRYEQPTFALTRYGGPFDWYLCPAMSEPAARGGRSKASRMARPARLERATSWFVARRSIQLS